MNEWIRKIEIDTVNLHLYCCTTLDLYIYDFDGRLMRSFIEIHRAPITSCLYSATSRAVLTGSMDNDIKVWSLNGGLLHTFRGHSQPVSNLILNPFNSNLVISSSVDGTIRMWSLDIMQSVHEYFFSLAIYFDSRIYIHIFISPKNTKKNKDSTLKQTKFIGWE